MGTPARGIHLDRGTSLIEAIVALGLLAGVLLSACGLFQSAARQVRAGANVSLALATARSVLEELELVSFRGVLALLACDATLGSCEGAATAPAVSLWNVRARQALHDGLVQVEVEAVGAPALAQAPGLRIRVRISWSEGARRPALVLAAFRS